MSYTKKIVCLANSGKPGGLCFAGKEVLGKGYGGWIRPVSAGASGAISEKEQKISNGGRLQILDVVTIPMLEPRPFHHQQENHLIHSGRRWEKIDSVDVQQLPKLLDSVAGDLWISKNQGRSGRHGTNDRVGAYAAKNMGGSLLLIQPKNLKFIVQYEPNKWNNALKVRADFDYNGRHYRLAVTDPYAKKKYKEKSALDGKKGLDLPREYPIAVDDVYLCLSLTKELEDHWCYKLVAAIIGDDD